MFEDVQLVVMLGQEVTGPDRCGHVRTGLGQFGQLSSILSHLT